MLLVSLCYRSLSVCVLFMSISVGRSVFALARPHAAALAIETAISEATTTGKATTLAATADTTPESPGCCPSYW